MDGSWWISREEEEKTQQREENWLKFDCVVSHLEILVVLLNDVDKIKPSEVVYLSIIVCRQT